MAVELMKTKAEFASKEKQLQDSLENVVRSLETIKVKYRHLEKKYCVLWELNENNKTKKLQ